jgi:hypothetical protein
MNKISASTGAFFVPFGVVLGIPFHCYRSALNFVELKKLKF